MELFATRFEGSQNQNIFQKQNEIPPFRKLDLIEFIENTSAFDKIFPLFYFFLPLILFFVLHFFFIHFFFFNY